MFYLLLFTSCGEKEEITPPLGSSPSSNQSSTSDSGEASTFRCTHEPDAITCINCVEERFTEEESELFEEYFLQWFDSCFDSVCERQTDLDVQKDCAVDCKNAALEYCLDYPECEPIADEWTICLSLSYTGL